MSDKKTPLRLFCVKQFPCRIYLTEAVAKKDSEYEPEKYPHIIWPTAGGFNELQRRIQAGCQARCQATYRPSYHTVIVTDDGAVNECRGITAETFSQWYYRLSICRKGFLSLDMRLFETMPADIYDNGYEFHCTGCKKSTGLTSACQLRLEAWRATH